MSESKTRKILMDAARQLFARMGFSKTTMNDIALASKRGRRTLYTYFSSKEDIFSAIVEDELELLINSIQSVSESNLKTERKLLVLMKTRLETIREVVYRNGSLKADLFQDIRTVERLRKKYDQIEIAIIRKILEEGVASGEIAVADPRYTAMLIHHALKGLEVPYITGAFHTDDDNGATFRRSAMQLIYYGIKRDSYSFRIP